MTLEKAVCIAVAVMGFAAFWATMFGWWEPSQRAVQGAAFFALMLAGGSAFKLAQ